MVFVLPVLLFGGTLTSFWLFINALMLIAHMPLSKSHIPPNLHYALLQLLDMFRLNSEIVQREAETLLKQAGLDSYLY